MIGFARSLAGVALVLGTFAASSAQAADRMIPAGSPDFGGEPWFRALAYCGAVFTERTLLLKGKGDTEGETAMRDIAVGFASASATQLQKDRGLDEDASLDAAYDEVGRMRYIAIAKSAAADGVFEDQVSTCARVLKAYSAL